MFSNGQTTSPTALSVNGNTFTNNTVRPNVCPCILTNGKRLPTCSKLVPLQVTVPQTGVGGAISLNNIISLNMTENSFTDNTAAQGGALFVVGTSTSSLGLQSSRWPTCCRQSLISPQGVPITDSTGMLQLRKQYREQR